MKLHLRSCLTVMIIAVAVFHCAMLAEAKIEMPGVFRDGMVLQRDKPLVFFGTANAGELIRVDFAGQSASTKAKADGSWRISLAPKAANSSPQVIRVSEGSAPGLSFRDVLVGDVWLFAGNTIPQEMLIHSRALDEDSTVPAHIRELVIEASQRGKPGLQFETAERSAKRTPLFAVARDFALRIDHELGGRVPIGIVAVAGRGFGIDFWLAPEGVAAHPGVRLANPVATGSMFPSGSYNGGISPVAGFPLRGVLWYSVDVVPPAESPYAEHFQALIEGWRAAWHDPDLPFYLVEYPRFHHVQTPGSVIAPKALAEFRWAQARTLTLPNTGMAPINDVQPPHDSDLPSERVIADRLAQWALKNEYGRANITAGGPTLDDIDLNNKAVAIYYTNIGRGLCVSVREQSGDPAKPARQTDSMEPKGFSVAGPDGVWHDAHAVIDDDLLEIWADGVREPAAIAYGMSEAKGNQGNLYNVDGLPAVPFVIADIRKRYMLTTQLDTSRLGLSDVATIEDYSTTMTPPPGRRPLLPGTTPYVGFAPPAGFYVDDVLLDGKSIGAPSHYIFGPLAADHTLTVRIAVGQPPATKAAVAEAAVK